METSLRRRTADKRSTEVTSLRCTKDNTLPTPPLSGALLSSLETHLMQPFNSLNLAIFRIIFGFIMSFLQYRIVFLQDVLEPNFSYAEINFHYCFARGIPHVGLDKLVFVIIISGIAAFCIGIGLFYRLSCGIFLVTYTYLSLLEKTRYNNHFYLYILLTSILLVTDCHKRLSVDSCIYRCTSRNSHDSQIPFWQVFLFRFQLFVVYFYAGLAKLNYDWFFRFEPMTIWSGFPRFSMFRKIASLLLPNDSVQKFLGTFFSIGGLSFDLFIGFFLLIPKLRPVGILFTFFFHLSNHFLFKIGTFPWVMIGTNFIFLDAETLPNLIKIIQMRLCYKQKSNKIKNPEQPETTPTKRSLRMSKPLKCFLLMYVVIQVLVPFRHWLYPGNVNWTLEGHQFSWRMMLNEENVIMRINIIGEGKQDVFDPYQMRITVRQIKRMLTDPELVVQLVRHIKQNYVKPRDHNDVAIKVDMWKMLNGRPYQRYIDSDVDLTAVNQDSFSYHWLVPQMSDDSLNFTAIEKIRKRWSGRGYDVSFFMESPQRVYQTFLNPDYCFDVRLFSLNTQIEVTIRTRKLLLKPGKSVIIPSNAIHRIATIGHAPSIWYYVFDCHVSFFHQAQLYISEEGWKYPY
ncbi:vitamin K-dependent gamma-carboxylase-like [Actinia tenebrosa]|uniref:Vitamin K-dependent gamma-carboxylase n=1 Tax=Actinia tenebrosa TaxID=6105 RepID=A0A6P8IMR8_ACTTE|nr:vitamin K-dependent gamma-carboxylase-like [Actinia tenebrosa]